MIRILKGIQKFFELHEFSNYKSLDYFSQILKKISRECSFSMQSIVQAKKEQYIQILFIRNVYIFLSNNIVKIYRNMRIRILQLVLLSMLHTLLSKSLHDAFFLWPFLLRQPPTIEFKQILRFQNIWILWYSNWNIRTYCSRIPKDEKN